LFVHCAGAETPGDGYYFTMSKAEILEELPKLTPEDRLEIRQKLNEIDGDEWLDSDDPLTDDEKALLEVRLDAYKENLTRGVPGRK
jgi:phage-related protein